MFGQRLLSSFRRFSRSSCVFQRQNHTFKASQFDTNSEYFDQLQINRTTIDQLIAVDKLRKSNGNIIALQTLFDAYSSETNDSKKKNLRVELIDEIKRFSNDTHPTVSDYDAKAGPIEVYTYGDLHKNPNSKALTFDELTEMSNTCRMHDLGNFTGPNSYYLMDSLADLEQALIQYTVDSLLDEGFELMSVPDILPDAVIDGCGMQTKGDKHQVFCKQFVISKDY